jgi:GTP-binding protein
MARYHHHLVVWYRRLAMSQHQFSSFSTSAAAVVQPTAVVAIKSRRQAFKQLQVHPSIRISIENLGIGIPPRKQRTRSFLPSSSRATEYNRPIAPRPFGTKPRLVRHVGKADELITTAASAATGSSTSTTATTTTTPSRKPPPLLTLPEVAIAGRSNVGKSTLLNALLFYDAHRLKKGKHKAIVSKRPGETIQIAIYELEKRLRIVDLPGYGFAYGKKQYQELVVNYLSLRGNNILKRVLLLIDARHGLKTTDIEFLELLQQSSPYKTVPPLQLVLTKCDTVKQADLARRVAQVQQQLSDALRREPSKSFPVLLVSVNPPRQVAGVYELQKTIAMLAKKKKKSTNDDDIDAAETVETASRANTTTTTTTATGPAKLATTNNTNTINNSYNNSVQSNSRQPTSKHDHQNRFHRKFRSRSTTTTANDAAPTFTNSKSTNRVDYSSGGTSSRPRTTTTTLRDTGRRSRSNNHGETVRTTTTTGTRNRSTNRVDDSSGGTSSRPRTTTTTIRDTGRRSRSNNHGETVRTTTTSTGTRSRSSNRVDDSSGGTSSRPRTTTTLRDTGRRSRSHNDGETVRTPTTGTRNRSTNRVHYSSGGSSRPRTTTTGTKSKTQPPLRASERSSGNKFNDSRRNNLSNSSGRPSVPKSRHSDDKQTWNNKTSRQTATRKPFAGRSNHATASSYGKTTQTRATGPTRKSSPPRRRAKQ